MGNRKTYFYAAEDINHRWIAFIGQNWEKMYFAGWWEDKAKYIIQALTNLYWEEKAKEIYYWFLEWLKEIQNLDIWKDFKFPIAALVEYKRDDDKDEATLNW